MAAIAAVGCGDGIFIEVKPPPGVVVDRVELIIGDRPCRLSDKDCEGVQPPQVDRYVLGDMYYRVEPGDGRREFGAPVIDGVAQFQLAVGTGEVEILALGSSETEGVIAAGIMIPIDLATAPVRYLVQLEPVVAPVDAPDTAGGVGATVWTSSAGARCVGVNDFASRGPVFIVPESDTDCDGATLECDPLNHLASRPPDLTAPVQCAIDGTDDLDACVLGHAGCDESVTLQACTATEPTLCVGDAVCDQCGSKSGAEFVACSRNVLTLQTTSPPGHFQCVLEVQPDAAGGFMPCGNAEFVFPTINAQGVIALDCVTAEFASLDQPFTGLAPTVMVDTGNTNPVSLGALTIGGQRCQFELHWSGRVDASAVSVTTPHAHALVGITINVPGDNRVVMFPLDLKYLNQCTDTVKQCVFVPAPNDGIINCGAQ